MLDHRLKELVDNARIEYYVDEGELVADQDSLMEFAQSVLSLVVQNGMLSAEYAKLARSFFTSCLPGRLHVGDKDEYSKGWNHAVETMAESLGIDLDALYKLNREELG